MRWSTTRLDRSNSARWTSARTRKNEKIGKTTRRCIQYSKRENSTINCTLIRYDSDREMIRNDLNVVFREQEQLDEERQYARYLNAYRQSHQRMEDSREWDLNNPNQWKLIGPTRIGDDDPRLGPSSAQIFAGEDLRATARKRAQQEQMKGYYQLQVIMINRWRSSDPDRRVSKKIGNKNGNVGLSYCTIIRTMNWSREVEIWRRLRTNADEWEIWLYINTMRS